MAKQRRMSVFRLVSEIGLPLDLIVEMSKERGLTPNWPVFIRDAAAGGWTRNKIQAEIMKAIEYNYPPEGIKAVTELLLGYLPEQQEAKKSKIW